MLALRIGKGSKEAIARAENFLLSVQKSDGSFPFGTLSNTSCMETTAVALMALKSKEAKEKIVSYILKNQNPSGFWEIEYKWIPREERKFPSVTGFVLSALGYAGYKKDNHVEKGIKYLLTSQKNDGSWGSTSMAYDTPLYPIYINVIALQIYKESGTEKAIEKAINFTKKNKKAGFWNITNLSTPDNPSPYLITALALNTLLEGGEDPTQSYIQKAVQWLIQHQRKDGSWYGGYFVTSHGKVYQDIFATCMSILALKRYQLALQGGKPPFFI